MDSENMCIDLSMKHPPQKVRHDWYQTETHVVVNIMLKNAPKNLVKIIYRPDTLSVTSPLPSSDAEYSLEIDLPYEINPSESSHVVLGSKIEIKLKKVDGYRWQTLERTGEEPKNIVTPIPQCVLNHSNPVEYPSSCPSRKDWNKIESMLINEEKNEKVEGEEGLNRLFANIYGLGSEEVKMAMNKSFLESGGTVLSTNWNEVSKEKVKVQPPDGMEWKKWE